MADEMRPSIEIRHGYTPHDLEQMARAATNADRSAALDRHDRHDIAWSAIAEALWTAEAPPARRDLIAAGWKAIYRAVQQEYRHHGYAGRQGWSGPRSAPRFVAYWAPSAVTSHEEQIVERLAIQQVLAPLTPKSLDAVRALAVHGDYRAAAQAIGLKQVTLRTRLGEARKRAIAAWFEGETPRRTRRVDRRVGAYDQSDRCPAGHLRAENTRIQRWVVNGVQRTKRRCRACDQESAAARRGRRTAA